MHLNRRSVLAAMAASASAAFFQRKSSATAAHPEVTAAELAQDHERPQFHLLPRANWMNDPNAPIYWKGLYHLFYQYNPERPVWGNIHWGHAVSEDMVHWRHLPVALTPSADGADGSGCFTGTAAVCDEHVVAMYTGVREVPLLEATVKDNPPNYRERQCLAIAEENDLVRWKKLPSPVIEDPPTHLCVNGFRDPSLWQEGEWWHLVIGSGIANQGGAVLLYHSRDLRQWEYCGILARRAQSPAHEPWNPWETWECPEFFALGNWHVLIYSAEGKCYWNSGHWDAATMSFHPEQTGLLDYGNCYAVKTQCDAEGHRVMWGWVTEARSREAFGFAGWAGVMSLPREISIDDRGRLRIRMVAAVHKLRGQRKWFPFHGDTNAIGHQLRQVELANCCGELCLHAQASGAGFSLEFAETGVSTSVWLTVAWSPQVPDAVQINGRPLAVSVDDSRAIEMHVYVDGSVMEVIVNSQAVWTARFYPGAGKAAGMCVRGEGALEALSDIELWPYAAISTDRLTH